MGTGSWSLLPGHPTPIPHPGGGRRVGHKEEMGRGADREVAAAGAGPPSRGSESEGEPFPPRLPLPGEAAPTFLQAQDPPGPREIPKLCPPSRRQPVSPGSRRQLRQPIHPRGRPVFTSGRGRGAGSGGGGGPTAGPEVPVTPPPSSPTWTPSSALRCSGSRRGAGSAGRVGRRRQ